MEWKGMERIILEYSSLPLFGSFNGGNGKFIPLFGSFNGRNGKPIPLFGSLSGREYSFLSILLKPQIFIPSEWERMQLDLIIFFFFYYNSQKNRGLIVILL